MMKTGLMPRLGAALFIAIALLLAVRSVAAQTDVIRGRVTGPDSQPVPDVAVTVTSMSGNVTRTTKTDRNGRFTVTFAGDEGDYMVSFAAMGYAAKRFEVKRTADQEILVADTRLQRFAARLDPLTVRAQRNRPNRNDLAPDVSGTERSVNNNALPADQMGDLAAMAATLPGVQLIPSSDGSPSGFSVLGLATDQNNMTLNGLQFGGSNLPRDAQVSSSLVTSPYDVSRGGFSGGQFSLRTRPGSNFVFRSMSLNADNPRMQWTDPAGQALGQQYSNLSLGGLLAGPVAPDKAWYNVSYQLGRRANDLQTLLNTDSLGLLTAGVAIDSARRLERIVAAQGIPATLSGIPNQRVTDNGSLLGSFDLNPPFSSAGQTFNLTTNGSWNRTNPASASVTELPAHSGERTNWNGGIQARHTTYLGVGVLSETSIGVNEARNYGTPYLQLPSGTVLVNSLFSDGSTGLKPVLFGGSTSIGTSQSSGSTSLQNQLSWFSENNKHRLKLNTEIRHDSYVQNQTTNLLGSFAFNSLGDLEGGRPASFTRQLSPRRVSGSQIVGALSLGDAYKPTTDLQITYGIRFDGNRFLSQPAFNPNVARTFGVANDNVPDRVYASPRIGFSYTYGTAAQIGGFEGAFRGPRAVVRGGIGLFQSTPSTGIIGNAVNNTGLPDAVQQINCVGAATPVPDWTAYAADPSLIPTHCADGSTGTVFANAAPNVWMFDPRYAAPRSLRSNLNWQGMLLDNRFVTSIDATYSLNLDQQGFVDLNFSPVPRFQLADEDRRPVYVQPSSIVPVTGAIAAGDARVSPQFARVTELRSDLESVSEQLTVSVSPFSFNSRFNWSLSYVYANVRDQMRGFSSTVASPLDISWGRSSSDFRHQLQYTLFYNVGDIVRVNWFGRLTGGTPYTPMIGSDVNGDGYANDRAFIFDPDHTADTSLASAMRSLLEHGSGSARDCLRRQLGSLAGRNSCQGPWNHTATMTISFNPLKVRMPQRATLSLQLSNPLGAADLLLHGENGLRGWGQPSIPDPALLYVRGFDPQALRYRYEVNQRFGATSPAFTAFRAPVTLTAMLRVDLGPTRERQMLTTQLDRGRRTQGQTIPEPMLKMMLSQGLLPNPLAAILREADTLALTEKQADSVATLNRFYTIRVDSIWSPVAKYLAALPKEYDHGEAYDRYRAAREQSIDVLAALTPAVRGVLTREQYRKLPTFVSTYLDTRYLASIRSGTAGLGGAMMLPGGGAMMMGSDRGGQMIIRMNP